jgi:hypothetical protein
MTPLTLCIGNLPPRCREATGRALAVRFGGWTRTRSESTGAWADATGEIFEEPMDRWEVATADPEAFAGMILAIGETAGEQAVYVITGGVPRIIETAHAKPAK